MTEPTFSIIVPTYNRAAQLASCLEGLARLDYPRDRFEVLVVDDGSETSPEIVIAPFRGRVEVTLLAQEHGGPAAARNTGARAARGRYLVFTDDDCTPAADWLRALESRFGETPFHAIGGPTTNAYPDNIFAVTSQLILDMMFARSNADPSKAHLLASNNLALPADGFHAIHGFDASQFPIAAGEDRDICERWVDHGHGIIYASEVRVCHAHRLSLSDFCRQHFDRGRAVFWLGEARRKRGAGEAGGEGASFLETFRLSARSLAQTRRRQLPSIAVLLAVWRICHSAGLSWEWMSARTRQVVRARP
jgi:glycosyltransferase involved in cell wall biosynthesis